MDIEINDKTYEINDDIELGTLYRLQQYPDKIKYLLLFLREALLPTPTMEEVMKIKKSDVKKLMEEYELLQKEEQTESKKKRSRL